MKFYDIVGLRESNRLRVRKFSAAGWTAGSLSFRFSSWKSAGGFALPASCMYRAKHIRSVKRSRSYFSLPRVWLSILVLCAHFQIHVLTKPCRNRL
jgi:hypothetical protein